MASVDPLLLKRATVFSTLTEAQLARLAEAGDVTEHEVDDRLTEQGVIGHRFRLILEGAADVQRDGARVSSVGKGDFIGEISLLGGGPATATVRCTTPVRCLTIWRERFWEILEAEPAIALRILEVVCRRLQREFAGDPMTNLPA